MTFVDTAHFVALALRRDALHVRAVAWSRHLRTPLLTTDYVLWELFNLLSAPINRPKAHALLTHVRTNPAFRVVAAESALFESGVTLHADRSDKSWSLTDCISFIVMQDARVKDALTNDHHFEQAGFNALLRRDVNG